MREGRGGINAKPGRGKRRKLSEEEEGREERGGQRSQMRTREKEVPNEKEKEKSA